MAGDTTTSLAAVIQEKVADLVSVVWREKEFLSLFGEPQPQDGDSGYRLPMHLGAASDAEEYTEGAPLPVSGAETYGEAVFPWRYFRVPLEVTGHARDAIGSGNIGGFGTALAQKLERCRNNLLHKINTAFMDTSAGGLLGLADNSTAFGGLSRTTYTVLRSSVTAVGGVLTLAALRDIAEAQRATGKAGQPTLWLTTPNQVSNYVDLGLPSATVASWVATRPTDAQAPYDLGVARSRHSFEGAPIVEILDLTNTVWLGLDMRPDSGWRVTRVRDFEMKDQAPNGDSDIMQISWGGCISTDRPERHSKLTGVTA